MRRSDFDVPMIVDCRRRRLKTSQSVAYCVAHICDLLASLQQYQRERRFDTAIHHMSGQHRGVILRIVLLKSDTDELAEVLTRSPCKLVAAGLEYILERHDRQEAHWHRRDASAIISNLHGHNL